MGLAAELTAELLVLPACAEAQPQIIAHSSARHGNQQILQAGAQQSVAKIGDTQSGNPALREWLLSYLSQA